MMVTLGFISPAGSVRAASSLIWIANPHTRRIRAHITDGIMVWGIIIVAIIFAGTLFGQSRAANDRPRPPKQNE